MSKEPSGDSLPPVSTETSWTVTLTYDATGQQVIATSVSEDGLVTLNYGIVKDINYVLTGSQTATVDGVSLVAGDQITLVKVFGKFVLPPMNNANFTIADLDGAEVIVTPQNDVISIPQTMIIGGPSAILSTTQFATNYSTTVSYIAYLNELAIQSLKIDASGSIVTDNSVIGNVLYTLTSGQTITDSSGTVVSSEGDSISFVYNLSGWVLNLVNDNNEPLLANFTLSDLVNANAQVTLVPAGADMGGVTYTATIGSGTVTVLSFYRQVSGGGDGGGGGDPTPATLSLVTANTTSATLSLTSTLDGSYVVSDNNGLSVSGNVDFDTPTDVVLTGLQPGTSYTVSATITPSKGGDNITTKSLTFSTTGGGGGGGGASGGSSGNTANMAANLSLNYVYGDTATQDVQITVFGEEVAPVTADETVVVYLPAADLKGLVTFSVGNTGQAAVDAEGNILQYPNINLVPSAVLDSRKAGLKVALKSNPRSGVFADDGANSVKTLSYHLYNSTTYTDSILDTSIPVEAIKSQMPQEVMISDLDAVITAIDVTGGETASVSTDQEKALVALFETAVYAGRVTKEDTSPHLDLVDGDSITLYVRYDLAQTRRYAADDDVLVHSGASGAQTVSLTFGGKTFDITFNNADDDAKETGTGSKIYAFKFVANSGSSVFASA